MNTVLGHLAAFLVGAFLAACWHVGLSLAAGDRRDAQDHGQWAALFFVLLLLVLAAAVALMAVTGWALLEGCPT